MGGRFDRSRPFFQPHPRPLPWDTVLVTDDGAEMLTYYPRDLGSLTIPV